MTAGPALACPRCKRVLGPESWRDDRSGQCFRCETEFEFVGFPALRASRARVAAQPAVLADDSVCFFHAENRAEAICDGCGRLLCTVCAVPFAGQKLCPSCVAATRSSDAPSVVRDRVLYDSIALSLAVLPLIIWPFTLATAPISLGMVVYGWNKPGSLVRGRSRVRLIIAGLLATLEIAAWITGFVVWSKNR